MIPKKQIVIDIDIDGNCSIDGQEFHGTECAHFINEIEQSLGTKISQQDKPEYRQRNPTRDMNIQRGGR